jgi:diketogulonate reductase-like aldo/keto reductase
VKTAIKVGYKHLDNAEMYNTEIEVGKAIKQSSVPRDQLFITTKVHRNIDNDVGIHQAIDLSLKKLQLDHVDLYLLHQPFFANGDKKKFQDAWTQMEEVAALGKAKSIGVSNFRKDDLAAILETCRVRPANNQIEFHPYLQHGDLVAFMKNQDITISAYGPLTPVTRAQGGPLDPILDSLAKKYAVHPGEILLRWCVDQGITPITTSSKEQRMSDMMRIFAFQLTPKEVENITETGKQHHFRGFWKDKFADDDRS